MFEKPRYLLVAPAMEDSAREVLGQVVDYDYDDLYTKYSMVTNAGITTKTFGKFVSDYKLRQQKAHTEICDKLIFGG